MPGVPRVKFFIEVQEVSDLKCTKYKSKILISFGFKFGFNSDPRREFMITLIIAQKNHPVFILTSNKKRDSINV